MTIKTALRFTYKNYKGEIAERTVIPEQIRFLPEGTLDHKQPGWFMDAWCLSREARRTFLMSDILSPMVEVSYE